MSEAGTGLAPAEDHEDNTLVDEEEPDYAADYEDDEFDPHEFQVADGGSICITCDECYDEGNHVN